LYYIIKVEVIELAMQNRCQ